MKKGNGGSTAVFDRAEARRQFLSGVQTLGLELTPEQMEQFLTYLDLLLKWNRKINLTALRTPAEILSRHFLDSLLLLPHLPGNGRVLDIGSGAGFPGLPLKIARPGLKIDLAEATAKKASFLKEALRRLELSGVNVFPIFLGEEPLPLKPAEPWDVFLSRGVQIEVVLRAIRPYWGPAGRLLLLKGPDWREEIERQEPLLRKQRVHAEKAIPLMNPLSKREWILVVLARTEPVG